MKFLFVSAWNDSGGGYVHRLLDGHPSFQIWPYELQLGTKKQTDAFDQWFKPKYRWPTWTEKLEDADPKALFEAITDEELKTILKAPLQAKHKEFPVVADIQAWNDAFCQEWRISNKTRHDWVRLYVTSFLSVRQDAKENPDAAYLVAHCPVINLDFDKIMADFPDARLSHVIRSPLSGFASMKRRHPALAADEYAMKWSLVNQQALYSFVKYPMQMRLLAFKDLITKPLATLNDLYAWLGVGELNETPKVSWGQMALNQDNMGPFGGVTRISAEYEKECINGLAPSEIEVIEKMTFPTTRLLEEFGLDLCTLEDTR